MASSRDEEKKPEDILAPFRKLENDLKKVREDLAIKSELLAKSEQNLRSARGEVASKNKTLLSTQSQLADAESELKKAKERVAYLEKKLKETDESKADVEAKAQEEIKKAIDKIKKKAQTVFDKAKADVETNAQSAIDGAKADAEMKAQNAIDEAKAAFEKALESATARATSAETAAQQATTKATDAEKAIDEAKAAAKKAIDEAKAAAEMKAQKAIEEAKAAFEKALESATARATSAEKAAQEATTKAADAERGLQEEMARKLAKAAADNSETDWLQAIGSLPDQTKLQSELKMYCTGPNSEKITALLDGCINVIYADKRYSDQKKLEIIKHIIKLLQNPKDNKVQADFKAMHKALDPKFTGVDALQIAVGLLFAALVGSALMIMGAPIAFVAGVSGGIAAATVITKAGHCLLFKPKGPVQSKLACLGDTLKEVKSAQP